MPRGLRLFLRIQAMALNALASFRLRAGFVVAGVALGIASLTVIVAAVDGAQRKALEITESFGPDAAFILGGDIFNRPVGQRTLTLSWNDALRLRQSLPGAYLVVPMRAKRQVLAKSGGRDHQVDVVVGATEDYAHAWNWPLVEGRDITTEDVERGARIALMGFEPSRALFGDQSPVGKTIFLQNIPFQVVGRLAYRGAGGGPGNIDDRIIIPLTTLTQRFNMDRKYFRALRIKFRDPEFMDAHVSNLRAFLRHLHGLEPGEPDDFTILTADEVLKFLSIIQGGLVVFLGVTATVAILVGGFVLANLFHLAVAERRAEIGLKKAMGARSSHILLQFLSEAVYLTLFGAVLGMFLGLGIGQALVHLEILEIRLSWKIFFLSLAAAFAIGIVFGLRPARNAAALNPIEALKS